MRTAILSALLGIAIATTGAVSPNIAHAMKSDCTSDQTTCDFVDLLIKHGG